MKYIKIYSSLLATQLAVTVSPVLASNPFADLIARTNNIKTQTAEKLIDHAHGEAKILIEDIKGVQTSRATDNDLGEELFCEELSLDPSLNSSKILENVERKSQGIKLVKDKGLDEKDKDFINAAVALKKAGIYDNPTAEQITAAKELLDAGLDEARLTADYVDAYIANGDDRAAALAFAALDSERFVNNANLVVRYAAGGNERASLLRLIRTEDFDNDRVVAGAVLIGAGLNEARLTADYVEAYIADGDDRAAALAFAGADLENPSAREFDEMKKVQKFVADRTPHGLGNDHNGNEIRTVDNYLAWLGNARRP